MANIYFPNTISTIFLGDGGGIPIVKENSNKLTSITITHPGGNFTKTSEFFDSLKNAPNLTRLELSRVSKMGISSLSDYLNYDLNSVNTLSLLGEKYLSIIKDLKGIEKFTNLKTLTVTFTNVTLDINAIKNCPTLETVNLSYCNINSLSGIEGLTKLKTLTINNNNITSLKPLENLNSLTSLNLENNAIADTSSYVDIDGSTKTYRNLDILAGLHTSRGGKLTTLKLAGNDNIIDFSPVSRLMWSNKSGF